MAGDFNTSSLQTIQQQWTQNQKLNNQLNQQYSSGSTTGSFAPSNFGFDTKHEEEKVDWAKFAMWLRGFLAAIEGQELTPESVSKIMEKLARVDPEAQLSFQRDALRNLQWYNTPNINIQPIAPTVSPNTGVGISTTGGWTSAGQAVQAKEDAATWTLYQNLLAQKLDLEKLKEETKAIKNANSKYTNITHSSARFGKSVSAAAIAAAL